jgi:hypothetical protein
MSARRLCEQALCCAALGSVLVAGAWAEVPAAQVIGEQGRLSATLVGELAAGGSGRLAVRWDGAPGALLDAWVDLDDDGQRAPEELVAQRRPLAPGIEVIAFDLPADARVVAEPWVWVKVHDRRDSRTSAAAESGTAGGERDDCAWQPGFTVADLDGEVYALAVYDDGSGPGSTPAAASWPPAASW